MKTLLLVIVGIYLVVALAALLFSVTQTFAAGEDFDREWFDESMKQALSWPSWIGLLFKSRDW